MGRSVLNRLKITKSGAKISRNSYMGSINFSMKNISIKNVNVTVDTGSAVTVIRRSEIEAALLSLCNDEKQVSIRTEKLINECIPIVGNQQESKQRLTSASSDSVETVPVIVNNLMLTSDIVIDRIKIYVSNDIKASVLGMDILGMFHFDWD